MTNNKEKIPPMVRLKYKKGDLIIKEGDFGISIYKIIEGGVGIFVQSGNTEINISTLGRGEFIGEMIFLMGNTEPHSASARAMEDCELEVFHLASLLQEHEKMPPILKYIASQAFDRLLRMNKVIRELGAKKEEKENKPKRILMGLGDVFTEKS
jgi:CRP-like cAMP-binding protein